MMGEAIPLRNRLYRAGVTAAFNLATWVVIPYFLYGGLSQLEGSQGSALGYGALSLNLIYTFGAIITGLEVTGALAAGMAISVPFVSGGYLASAYYIYIALNGGTLALESAGLKFAIYFEPLLFLLMLPSLFNAVKQPIVFLLESSESGREAADTI